VVAAVQWNIKDTPDSEVKEQEIWGIKGGAGKEFQLYYLVLSPIVFGFFKVWNQEPSPSYLQSKFSQYYVTRIGLPCYST
jgi:hypothetical protein